MPSAELSSTLRRKSCKNFSSHRRVQLSHPKRLKTILEVYRKIGEATGERNSHGILIPAQVLSINFGLSPNASSFLIQTVLQWLHNIHVVQCYAVVFSFFDFGVKLAISRTSAVVVPAIFSNTRCFPVGIKII